MKRVLEVFGEPISRGGQESFVISALQNMDLSDLHIDLFTPYFCDNKKFADYMSSIGGVINHINLPFKVGGTRREIVSCFDLFLKNHNKYDVVHIHSGSISVLAYYARVASQNGVKKIIVHSHSSGKKENLKHFLIKKYATIFFKRYATDFCACSYEAAKWKFPQSVLKKVKILKNGVNLKNFSFDILVREKMRTSYNINNDDFVLGHVGRFTYEKNQIFLIEVLKEYIDNFGKAKLVLVGDGNELNNVQAKAKRLGIEKNVIFVGFKDNVNEFMNMFDIFLFPSLYEGLGIVGIEAQASGLPVIASDKIPKFMDVSENTIFLNLKSTNEWCKEIVKLKQIGRKDYSQKIKEKGFDIENSSKDVRALYFS